MWTKISMWICIRTIQVRFRVKICQICQSLWITNSLFTQKTISLDFSKFLFNSREFSLDYYFFLSILTKNFSFFENLSENSFEETLNENSLEKSE